MRAFRGEAPARALATSLAGWFAGVTSLLVVATTVSIYINLKSHLLEEDYENVRENVAMVCNMLKKGVGEDVISHEVVDEHPDDGWMGVFIRIVDPHGKVLLTTPGFPAYTAIPEDSAGDRRVIPVRTSGSGDAFSFASRALVALPNGDTRTVEVLLINHKDGGLLHHYRVLSVLAVLASIAVAAISGWWFVKKGLAPIGTLGATIDSIGPRKLTERIKVEGMPREVAALAERFNTMIGRLEEAFVRLNRFTGDIAHELRTPVNNLRSMTELALARHGPDGPQGETFLSTLEECQRVSKLIDALLLLARVDDPHAWIVTEPLDLAVELQLVSAYYELAAADRRVGITCVAETVMISGDRVLLQRMIGNLVENALFHTPSGGTIAITAKTHGGWVLISVADTGEGIPADQTVNVFERFHRVGAANKGRVGLGLPIVRAVARVHGGDVAMRSKSGLGTTVEIRLPVVASSVREAS